MGAICPSYFFSRAISRAISGAIFPQKITPPFPSELFSEPPSQRSDFGELEPGGGGSYLVRKPSPPKGFGRQGKPFPVGPRCPSSSNPDPPPPKRHLQGLWAPEYCFISGSRVVGQRSLPTMLLIFSLSLTEFEKPMSWIPSSSWYSEPSPTVLETYEKSHRALCCPPSYPPPP